MRLSPCIDDNKTQASIGHRQVPTCHPNNSRARQDTFHSLRECPTTSHLTLVGTVTKDRSPSSSWSIGEVQAKSIEHAAGVQKRRFIFQIDACYETVGHGRSAGGHFFWCQDGLKDCLSRPITTTSVGKTACCVL